jgi:hypothetical protein
VFGTKMKFTGTRRGSGGAETATELAIGAEFLEIGRGNEGQVKLTQWRT